MKNLSGALWTTIAVGIICAIAYIVISVEKTQQYASKALIGEVVNIKGDGYELNLTIAYVTGATIQEEMSAWVVVKTEVIKSPEMVFEVKPIQYDWHDSSHQSLKLKTGEVVFNFPRTVQYQRWKLYLTYNDNDFIIK